MFFFLKRTIVYAGTVKGSSDFASFFLNGNTSPLGRKANAKLFWNERSRYAPTDKDGVFKVNGTPKAQPYILLFDNVAELTGKSISSDELYFELGKYPLPLPSNTIQGMSFCTLTPGETAIALNLCKDSSNLCNKPNGEPLAINDEPLLFNPDLLDKNNFINEAHLEFTLLADITPLQKMLNDDVYCLCRQVPISPFKPFQMDRADICMYSATKPLRDGTIPNIIIELKNKTANFHAYNQMVRYLRWLEKITQKDEFDCIYPLIVAPTFTVRRNKIDLLYETKIVMYSLDTMSIYHLPA